MDENNDINMDTLNITSDTKKVTDLKTETS